MKGLYYICVAKTRALISCAVTAQLISAIAFRICKKAGFLITQVIFSYLPLRLTATVSIIFYFLYTRAVPKVPKQGLKCFNMKLNIVLIFHVYRLTCLLITFAAGVIRFSCL